MSVIFSCLINALNTTINLIINIIQHQVTKLAYFLSHNKNKWLKNKIITVFLTHYSVNLKEAKISDAFEYKTFNDFFTRQLATGTRIIDQNPVSLVSPADGIITQIDAINNQSISQFKAKNLTCNIKDLLGNHAYHKEFSTGIFNTVYLAPYNYHRVHMPLTGKLLAMIHVPGKLASVSLKNTTSIQNLYDQNERVICIFDTSYGKMAVVLVGATLVGSIETSWHGIIRPKGLLGKISCTEYKKPLIIQKGEMIGWFHYGSTVITIINNPGLIKESLTMQTIKYGEQVAQLVGQND